jgi:lantibiotic modifying enzyme
MTPDAAGTAEAIGRRIARDAVWHRGRCNWVGAEPLGDHTGDAIGPVTYAALTPDLYAGTSGVALYLAELSAVTADPEARRTAVGAIRQALSRVHDVPPPLRLGLFSGWLGIALAAARVGVLLEAPELVARACALVRRVTLARVDPREFDVISGRAGAILALLALERMLDDPALRDRATRLGDDLVATAVEEDGGWSWRSPDAPRHRNLTGYSHGTAGVAHAALELFAATGRARYRDVALHAFRYERRWFDPDHGNWPDFRVDVPGRRGVQPASFATLWCHGAPGIALSRLRAHELCGDHRLGAEARAGLRTTATAIASTLDAGTGNYSLCHGLAGNADVLLHGEEILGSGGLDTVRSVAEAGIEHHGSQRVPWPCGTHCGETPNLMLGLAGIGHFYLRLHHPSTPSVLFLTRETFGRDVRADRRGRATA